MDADPKPHLFTTCRSAFSLPYCVLYLDGALHGIHSIGEIGKNACAPAVLKMRPRWKAIRRSMMTR